LRKIEDRYNDFRNWMRTASHKVPQLQGKAVRDGR
jgi:hypothetical protein